MKWFLFALAGPILWSFVNIIDNFLVANYSDREKERSSGGLVLFSSFIGIFISAGIMFFTNGIFDVPIRDMILLFISGAMTVAWIIFYLFALELEDTSVIAPWFLSVPIFGYILGYIFLNENLNLQQISGSLIIILGLVFLSIDLRSGKSKIKRKPALYMILVCLLVAVSGVIFKFVTIEGNFWVSSFWEYFGLGFTGFFMYLFIPKYRNEFRYMTTKGGFRIFILNTFTEFITISGNMLTNFALLLAPVAMVYIVGSFQPVFVLFLAILGTIFFPKIIKEDISSKNLIPKFVAITIMIVGSFILFSS